VIAFLGCCDCAGQFCASIYTVEFWWPFSFLREFAVLLTAILMAAATASAFTAQDWLDEKPTKKSDAIAATGLNPDGDSGTPQSPWRCLLPCPS